jgi:hypothetical protein
MADLNDGAHNAGAEKHGQARSLSEAALRARRNDKGDRSDFLMEEARRTDPQAVEDLLMEIGPGKILPDGDVDSAPSSDREVELMSRQIEPGSDAPSRVGITGSGSGADSQGQ